MKEPFAALFTQGMVVHETYRNRNGKYLLPAQVRVEGEGEARKAFEVETGAPVEIGPVEKMSKSKKNTVDLDEFISEFGADTARWFVLSDSPPERDVIYTDVGVQGARRFVQRVWRLVEECVAAGHEMGAKTPERFGPEAEALRRAAHKTLNGVSQNIEGLRFNVAVAQIYDLANRLQAAGSAQSHLSGDGMGWAIREATELLVQMIGPFMPHLGEDCWARLGYNTLLADRPWPKPEAALLVDDRITIAVQVNGKRRDELTVARTATKAEIEAAALQLDSVTRALEGRSVTRVIVVPQRIVNVVA
jgi:leucyl-tRNA synthetase